mmetsp:Transcript_63871/g.152327  ORF Transcript_63871/g.152327 Transcript_63871/m.152327 type:complete len:490 (-) Transcript_63871:94-1563(-)
MTVIWTPAAQGQLQGCFADDPPRLAVPRDPPLSARQRKQVYMHSALFSEGGSPLPHSKYVAARQVEIYEKIRTLKKVEPKVVDYSKPAPADMRATANSGQKVAESLRQVNSYSGPGQGTSVLFGDHAEPMSVVGALKQDEHLPKEFWGTNTKLNWTDERGAICRPQRPDLKAWSNTNATGRKRQDLSSEVISNSRLMQQSTQQPAQELRSAPMKNVHCTDTALDPQVDKKKTRSMTPRDRFIRNLTCSEDCQFNDQEVRGGSVPPPLRWRSGGGKRDSSEDRRRSERNFSDLTGVSRGSARRAGLSSNSHVHYSAGNNFLNPGNEVESRKGPGAGLFLSPRSTEEQNRSAVLGDYDPGQMDIVLKSARGPAEQEVLDTERPAFDTKSLMELESEITRRQREQRGATPRDRSASQRRKDFFAGGSGRMGTGATPRPVEWDNERPKSAQPTDRRQIIRSASSSPATGRRYGGFPPDSARARKMAAMQSSIL